MIPEYFLVDDVLYEWGPWKSVTSYMRVRKAKQVERLAEG